MTAPIGFIATYMTSHATDHSHQWYDLATIFIGIMVLTVVWRYRTQINNMTRYKNGRERYWLIISFLFLTIGLISISFFKVNNFITFQEFNTIRTLLGLSFLYIAGTSLFRLYPYTAPVKTVSTKGQQSLSDEECEIAKKVENLLRFEKVYQEQSYNRSTMAKELNVSESVLSRIVNLHFNETIPQLFNRYRVNEAKLLLKDGKIDITTISADVGFNSIATFNRVFKGLEGISPSEYIEKTRRN
jgi:AraC-like DNA-binding protein